MLANNAHALFLFVMLSAAARRIAVLMCAACGYQPKSPIELEGKVQADWSVRVVCVKPSDCARRILDRRQHLYVR